MIMKNIEIINQINAMEVLADLSLPVRMTYAIQKNLKKLEVEYQDYYQILAEIEKKYKDEEGKIINDKSTEYGKELGELLSIEVDIEFHMLPTTIFESVDFDITLQQMKCLDFMIE